MGVCKEFVIRFLTDLTGFLCIFLGTFLVFKGVMLFLRVHLASQGPIRFQTNLIFFFSRSCLFSLTELMPDLRESFLLFKCGLFILIGWCLFAIKPCPFHTGSFQCYQWRSHFFPRVSSFLTGPVPDYDIIIGGNQSRPRAEQPLGRPCGNNTCSLLTNMRPLLRKKLFLPPFYRLWRHNRG